MPVPATVVRATALTGGSEQTAAPFTFDAPDRCRIAELRVWTDLWIRGLQIVFDDGAGHPVESPIAGATTPTLERYALGDNEFVLGISGKYGRYIDSIIVRTNKGTKHFGGSGGEIIYELLDSVMAEGTEVSGLCGTANDNLVSIGLRYSIPGPIDIANHGASRWVDRNARPHPNLTTPDVFRVRQNDESLSVFHQDGTVALFEYSHADGADSVYRAGHALFRMRHSPEHGVEIAAPDGRTIVPVSPRQNQARVAFDEMLSHGFDAPQLDPYDLRIVGQAQRIFASPVPNGALLPSDAESEVVTQTVGCTSEAEHQRAMSASIGHHDSVSIDGVDASFSLNDRYHEAVKSSLASSATTTLSAAVHVSHTLVLDYGRVTFAPAFVDRVLELAHDDRQDPAAYDSFITTFGTHFAYAISFGSATRLEAKFSRHAVSSLVELGGDVAVEAGIHFLGIIGVSASEYALVDPTGALASEFASQSKNVQTVGSENEPVPILIDLRPITELLSPLFFDDTLVAERVRPGVAAALRRYVARCPKFSTSSIAPPIYEIVVDVLGATRPSHDPVGHYWGTIDVECTDPRVKLIGSPTIWSASEHQKLELSDARPVELNARCRLLVPDGVDPSAKIYIRTDFQAFNLSQNRTRSRTTATLPITQVTGDEREDTLHCDAGQIQLRYRYRNRGAAPEF